MWDEIRGTEYLWVLAPCTRVRSVVCTRWMCTHCVYVNVLYTHVHWYSRTCLSAFIVCVLPTVICQSVNLSISLSVCHSLVLCLLMINYQCCVSHACVHFVFTVFMRHHRYLLSGCPSGRPLSYTFVALFPSLQCFLSWGHQWVPRCRACYLYQEELLIDRFITGGASERERKQ